MLAVGRWPLAVGLTCAVWGLSAPQEAHAGEWVITKDMDGSKTSGHEGGGNGPWMMPRPMGYPPFAPWPPPGVPASALASPVTGDNTTATESSASASTSGTITFTCKWTPRFIGEMVPKAVLISTGAKASIQWRSDAPTPANFAGSAYDGVNKAVTTPVEGVFYLDTSYITRTWGSGGRLLHVLDGGGKASDGSTKTWTIPVKLSANFSGSVPSNNGQSIGGFTGMVSVGAENPVEDTRFVSLSRGGRHERTEVKDGVSTTYGDTTYSYTSYTPVPIYQANYQTIGATLSGGWAENALNSIAGRYNVTWNWTQTGDALETGTTAGDHYDHAVRIATKGGLDFWTNFMGGDEQWCDADGKFSPKPPAQATLKYFARDNVDQAEAEARYIMTVHEPLEVVEKRALVKTYKVISPAYVQDASGQWVLLDLIGGYRAANTYTATINKGAAKSQGFSFGFGGDIKPFGIGLGLSYQHDAGQQWYKEFGQSISNPELSEGERAYLEIVFDYQRLYSTYRRFDAAGEIRSPNSPAVPEPSIPFKQIWDETDGTPSQQWHILEPWEAAPGPENGLPTYSVESAT